MFMSITMISSGAGNWGGFRSVQRQPRSSSSACPAQPGTAIAFKALITHYKRRGTISQCVLEGKERKVSLRIMHTKNSQQIEQLETQKQSKESEWRLALLRPISPKPELPKELTWNQEHLHNSN